MWRKRLTRRAAFTLIEVMIVTTIMTSQANNYGDVKRIAYQQSCQNNLRQLYQAMLIYDMTNGVLPDATFFPKRPNADPRSLIKLLDTAYKPMLACPVFPDEIRNKGLTYIYNDSLAGQTLGSISNARETWLLMEMNAVSDQIPMPHPGGYNTLYADGRVVVSKQIPPFFAELQEKMEQEQAKQKPAGSVPAAN